MSAQDTGGDQTSVPLLASSKATAKGAPDESWTKLYENFICSEFSTPLGLSNMVSGEKHCKTDSIPVQKKLASVTSKQVNLDTALVGAQLVSVEWTWVSSLTLAVASGPYMRLEILFMILASVTPEDERFPTFTLGQMVVLVPNFLAKMASAYLMDKCIWYPLALGIGSLTLAIAALFWDMPIEPSGQQTTKGQFNLTTVRTQFGRTLRVFFTSGTIFFLIITFSFTNVFGQLMSGSTLLQVLTRKFGMSLKDARFIFCAAGQGFRMAARSELSLTKNIPKENINKLYILIFYMDMIGGGLFNSWVLARSFNEGLDHGGLSLGLPLYIAVAEWSIVALIVITAKGVQLYKSNGTGGAA
ncbi:hypothetical protein DL98DRAFT_639652 [Cadophora sp. DSE1049]|nr:hypothetical protein DL98DRAFT_639652 [Cadophora sp. DSE1049]